MDDKLNGLKELIKEAEQEVRSHVDGACIERGWLWWRKSEHEWGLWNTSLVKKLYSGTPQEGIIGYHYARRCKHCGTEQFKYKGIE